MTKIVRYLSGVKRSYGLLEGDVIAEVEGGLFDRLRRTGATHPVAAVKILFPCEPHQIFAVGLNYRSHLGERKAPEHPEIFYKPISSLQNPNDPIVLPADAQDTHYEGELVVVIGKAAKNVTVEQARDVIFGVTCGNDVSDRNWQRGAGKDLQWWRAKGSDTFSPLGPAIVTDLDYGNLLLQTRLNGEVVQKQSTSDLLFDPPAIISWISRWVTLNPGDLIYTGTPGETRSLQPGDVVEVELESVGTLSNPVA